jgi:hypothetical protein
MSLEKLMAVEFVVSFSVSEPVGIADEFSKYGPSSLLHENTVIPMITAKIIL